MILEALSFQLKNVLHCVSDATTLRRFNKHVQSFSDVPQLPVTQIPFGHLSLALRVSLETWFGVSVTALAIL